MRDARRTAVVTGASSGIGAIYADRLANRGYDVILVARRAGRLATLAERLTSSYGCKAEVFVADLEKDSDLVRVERRLSVSPHIQMLVNNAGLSRLAPFAKSPLEDSLSQIALNVVAPTRLTHAVLPGLVARDQGVIVNVASVLAIETLPISSVYSGTKGFIVNFSRGLQAELTGTGVKVQLVLPAATATEIWEKSGVPLEEIDKATVMTAENLVDSALAGLDAGEAVTLPSLADEKILNKFDEARAELFSASLTGKPAPRYGVVEP